MKTKRLLFAPLAAILLLGTASSIAQPLLPVAEATIRDGANANVDINETTLNYTMVKYGTGSSAKSYYKFDFTGQNPNTNYALTFSFTTQANSQRQRVQMWSLEQAYPEYNSSVLVWNTAQANNTTNNSMLTEGSFTALPLVEFISPATANASRNITVPAPWGDLLIGNELVIVLSSNDDPLTNQNNGLRLRLNETMLSFTPLFGAPPSVSAITNVTVFAGQISDAIPFTLSDPDGDVNTFFPFANSSDNAVLPAGNVIFDGSGANRVLYVIGGATPGVADVTVNVTDENGNTGQRTFSVTVLPLDQPPVLFAPAHTNTLMNVAVTIPFTISDPDTAVENLIVDGEIEPVHSVNVLATLSFGGSGTNRTVTVTPVADADGVGVITLRLSDGNSNVSASFAVMVLPASTAVFSEHFDYADGVLFSSSASFWTRRGSSQAVALRTAGQQAWIRSSTTAESGIAPLVNGPFLASSRAVLYGTFKATWVDLGQVPLVGTSAGPFIHLYDAASANLVCSIATSILDAPEGYFRLRIANGTGYTEHPADLAVGATHTIVFRYDVSAARSTLWINPENEASPSVTATDSHAPVPISSVGLRQNSGMGNIYLDDLQITAIVQPVITGVRLADGNVEVDFTAGSGDLPGEFGLLRTGDLASPVTSAPASISSVGPGLFRATLPSAGSQGFYRIQRQSFAF